MLLVCRVKDVCSGWYCIRAGPHEVCKRRWCEAGGAKTVVKVVFVDAVSLGITAVLS